MKRYNMPNTPQKQGWKATFNTVMKHHNGYTADGGKVVSYATQRQRRDVLLQGFRSLRQHGFKFKTVKAFRGKHMACLAQQWEKEGLSAATLQNRLSIFRTFARWIGKPGMVLSAEHYVQNKNAVRRSYIATTPKTWSEQGVDSFEKIEALRDVSERFADALLLQRLFGLRTKESLLLRPHLADKGTVLVVNHGTKGGRTRYVPIESPEQRTLLDKLKATLPRTASLVPTDKNYAQFRNRYYYVLRQHGIRRSQGITPHGLRHEHLNALYEAATGHKAPVQGGRCRDTDTTLDSFGRQLVAERAGHSRESISVAYIGGKGEVEK